MTEMVNGSVERDIDYTPFDKPKQIEGADGSTTELFYGPERQLIREAVSGGSVRYTWGVTRRSLTGVRPPIVIRSPAITVKPWR